MTCNNQQSFHLLTIFEHHSTYNIRNDLGTFSWGADWMRGKNDSLQEVVPAKLLESRYFLRGQFYIKKQTVQWGLVTLPNFCGLGVLHNEVQVVKMSAVDEELMNSWRLRPCSWVSSNFYDVREYIIWGYLNVPPWHKNRPMSCHHLMSSPWHDIGWICIGF